MAAAAPRLGVAATRKLGSAVERNRAKRRAREMFRRRKIIGGLDVVIVPRREMLDAPFAHLEADIPLLTAPVSPARAADRRSSGLLRVYKILFSPLFAGSCRFYPSCADYMREAVEVHGVTRGVWLGMRRLSRCHPLGSHGVDPVRRARDLVHGTQGFYRHRPLVPGAVLLSGLLRTAPATFTKTRRVRFRSADRGAGAVGQHVATANYRQRVPPCQVDLANRRQSSPTLRNARSPSRRRRSQAVLTNRGGRLLHWRLKDYRDNRGEPVDLVPIGLPASEAAAVLAARR